MDRTDVLIVGAGPSGLMLAAELHRRGVDFRIVDKHPDVLEATKAAAVHARALEYFRDVGIADRILAEGQRVDILALRTGYRDRVSVDFRGMRDTAYPHMVDIPQARTEHILLEHLAAAGVSVERGWSVTALTQGTSTVATTLVASDGEPTSTDPRNLVANWVVGCDGARSTVRGLLGLEFEGADYDDDWVLCDAVIDWPLPRNEMTFSADTEGIYGVFPLPGERRYRLAYTQSHDSVGNLVEPDIADAQRAMERTGIAGTLESVDEFWTFNLAHRQAAHLRRGRVFLVGDAGHVHTPFGGQGLNLGVGDAVNLGWKLAAVCAGHAPATLLDSYESERHHVAGQVITFTHLGAQAMLLGDDPRRRLRDAVFGLIGSTPAARALMARRLSQLAHSYRGTPAVQGRGRRRLRPGDRLPDLSIFDGLTNRPVRLHDVVSSRGHTLLLTGARSDIRGMVDGLGTRWQLELHALVITPDWQTARQLSGTVPVLLDRGRDAEPLHGRRPMAYLVRPDRHIGYAGPVEPAGIERYLTTVSTLRTTTAMAAVRARRWPATPRRTGAAHR